MWPAGGAHVTGAVQTAGRGTRLVAAARRGGAAARSRPAGPDRWMAALGDGGALLPRRDACRGCPGPAGVSPTRPRRVTGDRPERAQRLMAGAFA